MNRISIEKAVFEPLKIGDLVFYFPVILAPMAGIADRPFRVLARRYGAGLVTSEMVSAEGIIRKNRSTLCLYESAREEFPLSVQIFGYNPERMAEAARIVESEGAAIVDINAGCPVRKVVRQGSGAALMQDPEHLIKIVSRVKNAVTIPVTIKMRSGWNRKNRNALHVASLLEQAGVDAVIIHPRTANEFFKGKADWSVIREIKESIGIPVIGNGDVRSPEDAFLMRQETGCDAIMIGRASIGNPWIFKKIRRLWEFVQKYDVSFEERRCVSWEHFEAVLSQYGLRSLPFAKSILTKYIRGFPEARATRKKILAIDSRISIRRLWNEYFDWLENSLGEKEVCFEGSGS